MHRRRRLSTDLGWSGRLTIRNCHLLLGVLTRRKDLCGIANPCGSRALPQALAGRLHGLPSPPQEEEGSGGADEALALRTELLDGQLDDVTFTQVRRRIHRHAHTRWRTSVDEVAWLQDHELADVVH